MSSDSLTIPAFAELQNGWQIPVGFVIEQGQVTLLVPKPPLEGESAAEGFAGHFEEFLWQSGLEHEIVDWPSEVLGKVQPQAYKVSFHTFA